MNTIKLALAASLAALSLAAMAADPSSDAARQQRMDEALQNYHSSAHNSGEGPAARAEDSIKRGAHKAGAAIERGAKKTGHAIEKGVHKTGEAIHHAGEKIEGATK
jgi:hypothetical protein